MDLDSVASGEAADGRRNGSVAWIRGCMAELPPLPNRMCALFWSGIGWFGDGVRRDEIYIRSGLTYRTGVSWRSARVSFRLWTPSGVFRTGATGTVAPGAQIN